MRPLGHRKVALLSCEDRYGPCRVEILTPAGSTNVALPAWPAEHPDTTGFEHPLLALHTTARGEAWIARCLAGREGMMGARSCERWLYARIHPAPGVFSTTAPKQHGHRLETIAAPAEVRVDLLAPAKADPDSGVRLRCSTAGGVREYGRGDLEEDSHDRAPFVGFTEIEWVSAAPPIFRATRVNRCADEVECSRVVTFQGCDVWKQFDRTWLRPGPAGVVALTRAATTTLLWRGRPYATVPLWDPIILP